MKNENGKQEKPNPTDFSVELHELSKIKKAIAVVSGKGGVGKSLVTSMLAVKMKKEGYNTAVLDADITGPSIPKAFGLSDKAYGNDSGMLPVKSKSGIDIMSINLLLENETDPVVWRGPLISGTVKQFWKDVIWKDIDFMFIDMPPGTGDVSLTVFQSLSVDGIIVVTSPQELVSMIVSKAVRMAELMKVPVIGIVENMSYVKCPECGTKIDIFGETHTAQAAAKHGLEVLATLPVDPEISKACDNGNIERYESDYFDNLADLLIEMEEKE